MSEVRIRVLDINDSNRRPKFFRAVEGLAKAMDIPLTMRPRDKENGEKFVYTAEEELVAAWRRDFADALDTIYLTVCHSLDLPKVTTFSKAIGVQDPIQALPLSHAILYHNKVIFNPETGLPIYREDFNRIINAIERFLNKRLDPSAKKIVLNSVALGRVMARRLLKLDPAEIRKLKLKEVVYEEKPLDWIAESLERQNRLMGPLREDESARLSEHYKGISRMVEVAEQSMGDHITQMEEDAVHAVRRSIINGVKGRSSKTEIAQDLFNKFGDLNRDWGRIAETETVESFNNAFLKETAIMAEPGEKVYFRRVEMRDDYVCSYCEKIRGEVALYVNSPLSDDKIEDAVAKVAIWEGKNNIGRKAKNYWMPAGTVHPWCRGSWERFFPDMAVIE